MESISEYFTKLLRVAGLKATPGRIALLSYLQKNKKPMTVDSIEKGLKGFLNKVTVYRALLDLTAARLVLKVDLGHVHAHYEFLDRHNHHHHIVCKNCGDIEDIDMRDMETLEKTALNKSKLFTEIVTHSLEFFGVCNTCAKISA